MARRADLAEKRPARSTFAIRATLGRARHLRGGSDGLLCQNSPKGTDLSTYTQKDLDAVADTFNSRLQATNNFRSVLEVSAETPANFPARLTTNRQSIASLQV